MTMVQPIASALAVIVILASTRLAAWGCPSGCSCGPVRDRWTYEAEFTVNCSHMNLKNVPRFNATGKVDKLDLTVNNISVLGNATFQGILPKRVDLGGNRISVIEPEAFIDIWNVTIDLGLSSNKVTQLPQGLDKMAALKTLTLTRNTHLKLSDGSFQGLLSLEKLVLSECYLKNIPIRTFDDVTATLQELYLEYNGLKTIPKAVQNLKHLVKINFDFNAITHLTADAFKGLSKLQTLSLIGNDFSQPESIHISAFRDLSESLHVIYLSQSNLAIYPREPLAPLKRLQGLILSSNKIKRFPAGAFQSLDSLKMLNLNGNPVPLTNEVFYGVEDTLQILTIIGHKLSQLPVEGLQELHQLQGIDASLNDFAILGDNFTKGIKAVRYTLRGMKISTISPKAFAGKKRPVYLDLMQNNVTNLNFITNPCDFEFVDVTNNPLVCDCHTLFVAIHTDLILKGKCTKLLNNTSDLDISSREFKKVAFGLCKGIITWNTTEDNVGQIYCPEPSRILNSCEDLHMNLWAILCLVIIIPLNS